MFLFIAGALIFLFWSPNQNPLQRQLRYESVDRLDSRPGRGPNRFVRRNFNDM